MGDRYSKSSKSNILYVSTANPEQTHHQIFYKSPAKRGFYKKSGFSLLNKEGKYPAALRREYIR